MKLSINIIVKHTMLDGRVKNIPVNYLSKDEIPVLLSSNFSLLVTKYFHKKYHRDVDIMVTVTMREFGIKKMRKIVSSS